MREAVYFIASLAGAAVLTALAVLVPPESPLWRTLLYGGIVVLLLCAIVLAIDMVRRWRKPLAGASAGTIGFRVSSKDNLFFNVESVGFDKGFELTESATGNRFFNTAARRACASELDDLFAEGVRERNRLIPTIPDFDPQKEDRILSQWNDRVMDHFGDIVAVKDVSRFRTLNLFVPLVHRYPDKSAAQDRIEAIWTEKLRVLREIIEAVGQ